MERWLHREVRAEHLFQSPQTANPDLPLLISLLAQLQEGNVAGNELFAILGGG